MEEMRIMHSMPLELSQQEIEIDREETAELLCRRHRLPRDVVERIVKVARNVDHAHALAELMR